MAQRSTKGASKQRRDAINERVAQIRELLPVSEAARSRLSQLQVMALSRSYIAKSNLFSIMNHAAGVNDNRETTWSDHFDFLQAVPGFLTIFDLEGKILYISDNVCDYLGNSAVDIITQTETLYDLVDDRDHAVIADALNPALQADCGVTSSAVRQCDGLVSFVCRMNTAARGVRYVPAPIKPGFERTRTMQVRGRRLMPSDVTSALHHGLTTGPSSTWRPGATTATASRSDCAFIAVCTPSLCAADVLSTSLLDGGAVAWDTSVFRSQHHLDMKFISVDANGEYLLGYEHGAIYGKSWYEMIHPDDVDEARFKHMDLMQSAELSGWRSLCVRVQSGGGDVIWLHVVMRVCDVTVDDVTQQRVVCINQLIDDNEARAIRANAASAAHDDAPWPDHLGLLRGAPPGFLDRLLADDAAARPRAGTKRRAAAAEGWAAAKAARYGGDGMLGDDSSGLLMSMPSPPLSRGGGGGNLAWHELAMTSSYGAGVPETPPPPYIPESFLTPNASPCSFTGSPPPPAVNLPVLVSDQLDLAASDGCAGGAPYVDELSFFDQSARAHRDDYDLKPTLPAMLSAAADNLPELDLPTLTSYFDLLENSDPLPPVPVSLDYCKAVPVGVAAPQCASTIDEDLLQNLFSTANSFLSSIPPPVKPFDFFSGGDLLMAHC